MKSMHPSEIRIGQYELSVFDLCQMIDNHLIVLDCKLGRWDLDRKSRSVESVLLGLTMTPVYVDASEPHSWLVLDGSKRLNAIYEFYRGNLRLHGVEFLRELERNKFLDLPISVQRRFLETKLTIYSFNQGISPEVRLSLIRRVVPDIKTGLSSKMHERLLSYESKKFIDSLFDLELHRVYQHIEKYKEDFNSFSKKLDFINLCFIFYEKEYKNSSNFEIKREELILYLNRHMDLAYVIEKGWNKGLIELNYLIENYDISLDLKRFIARYIEYFIFVLGYDRDFDKVKHETISSLEEFIRSENNFLRANKLRRIKQLDRIFTR